MSHVSQTTKIRLIGGYTYEQYLARRRLYNRGYIAFGCLGLIAFLLGPVWILPAGVAIDMMICGLLSLDYPGDAGFSPVTRGAALSMFLFAVSTMLLTAACVRALRSFAKTYPEHEAVVEAQERGRSHRRRDRQQEKASTTARREQRAIVERRARHQRRNERRARLSRG